MTRFTAIAQGIRAFTTNTTNTTTTATRATYTFKTTKNTSNTLLSSSSALFSSLRGASFSPLSLSLSKRFYNRPMGFNNNVVQQGAVSSTSKYLRYGVMGAGAGVLINMASGALSSPSTDSYRKIARQRIATTYAYLFGSVSVTAGLATIMYRNGFAASLMRMNQWVYLGVSTAAMIGSLVFTRSVPYENTIPKHLGLLGLNAAMAASFSGLGYLGGPLVVKAAAITGAVVGSLSLAGAVAPSESWMAMHGPLSVGLGVVFGASIGQLFFPSAMLANIALYGGAAVFGSFVLYDTTKIRYNAQTSTRYDPVNNSLHIYVTTMNMFRIVVTMLMNNRQKRK